MATFPSSDASSPTPTKVTSASSTIVSASFTPPVRSCLVVSITSDADVTTGAAPTISHTGGASITWTRVGPALGFSSAGDVGVVALFQGVFTDLASPPGSRPAMTVTVAGLPTASKPKLLIPRVYTEDQVDILDPIGATAGGSFSTGTLITGTITPETSEGGVRAIQLDWSATGVPTTFLPNNDNAELVDSFHNATLSTNLAIGGKRRTRAGVDETMGVRLLASATDGNWLIYELRGPQPAAGSAIDSTAFDTSFDTGGSTVPTGTGSGSWSFSGAGTGKRVARATGAESWSFVGSGSGKRNPRATGSGTFTFTGAGVGDAPTPPPSQGAGSGSWGFSGAGTGKRTPKASGAGTVTTVGTGTGRRIAKATGGGSLTWAATGTGKRTPKGGGTGGWTFTGSGTGRRTPKAGGSGSWTFTGTGLGNSPGVGMSEGIGTGAWSFTGAGVGKRSPKTSGNGTLLWAGTGAGKRRPVATGVGSWSLAATAVGYREPVATGSGVLAYVGTGVGEAVAYVPEPTPPERTLHVRGETRTLAVRAESRTLRVPSEDRTVEA